MTLAPYLGSLVLLGFAAVLVAATHLNPDSGEDAPLLIPGQRIELLIQLAACGVAFVAGWQL